MTEIFKMYYSFVGLKKSMYLKIHLKQLVNDNALKKKRERELKLPFGYVFETHTKRNDLWFWNWKFQTKFEL